QVALAWQPDGKLLAAAGADKVVRVWDAGTGKVAKALPALAHGVTALAWQPDGKALAVASSLVQGGYEAGTITLYDTTSWQDRSLPQLRVAPVWALAFSADGKQLAVAGKDNAVRLCDAVTGQETLALHGHLGWVRSLALARGGQVLVSGSF